MSTTPNSTALTSSNEVSNTRLYLGNLPKDVTKQDIEENFAKHGTGEITEIKLMNGFGFIEYKDAMDARDVVPAFHGTTFMGQRLTVQFARGTTARSVREPAPVERGYSGRESTGARDGGYGGREGMGARDGGYGGRDGGYGGREGMGGRDGGYGGYGQGERPPPRPRRTAHRMTVQGLHSDTSWQDLKDFARRAGVVVVFTETSRSGEGSVEFETAQDLATAIEKLNNKEFRDRVVTCFANVYTDHRRSRSPGGRRPYRDDFDRRGAPPGTPRGSYSPRREPPGYREGYRDRSPRRDYYDHRPPYPVSPRRGPNEDYQPPSQRPRYDDPYRRDYAPPPSSSTDSYANRGGPYERPPPAQRDFAGRDQSYARDGGYSQRDYDRRYW